MQEDNKTTKIKMWQEKLQKLEKEYQAIMLRRGEAMAMGDISENSAFEMLSGDADTWRVRIDEVRSIISKLEKEGK
ncbi:MAG: hypothetical protein Q7S44_03730 [bacterium]|nr:hypothetical protein [bacterium]